MNISDAFLFANYLLFLVVLHLAFYFTY